MGLYKRKDSNIWQMSFTLNGKKVRMSTKSSNKKIAQRIYEKARAEAEQGKSLTNKMGKMPFDQLVDEFLEKHSKVEKASYERDFFIGQALKMYFKKTPIRNIKPYDIKSWRLWRKEHVTKQGRKISKASLNRELSFLKTMFNMAVEWEWLVENPAAKVKKLRGEKKRMRYLKKEEISRLLMNCAPYLKPIIITAISTGMRRGEILNLEWKNVDFENGFIRVVKSKNDECRNIPLESTLTQILESLEYSRKIGNFVFCKEDGERRKCIKEAFNSACLRAGIEDFRFHDLRHTAASLLAGGGCDIITLQNILGHKTLAMTQRYAHLIPEKHEKTRRIIRGMWGQVRDTVWYTVAAPRRVSPLETPINP